MRLLVAIFLVALAGSTQAASFDCAKASTEIEHAICSDPELSRLDEEMALAYDQLLPTSRYYDFIRDNQRAWLKEGRTNDTYVFEQRLNYLHSYMTLATCLDGAETPRDCLVNERDALDYCMSDGDYTTVAMDSCAAAMAGAWDSIMAVETEIKRGSMVDDIDTLMIFDEASEAFDTYRQSECGWQYSEYRDGTIRGQIWFGCYLDLTSQRVFSLILGNQAF